MTPPSEMVEKLKPCPFCGGEASCSPADDSGEIVFAVACMSCEAQITKADEAGAIEQWNTRDAINVGELIGALREIDKEYREYGCVGVDVMVDIARKALESIRDGRE